MDPVIDSTEAILAEDARSLKAAEFAEGVDWDTDKPIETPKDEEVIVKTPEQEQAEVEEQARLVKVASEQGKTVEQVQQEEQAAVEAETIARDQQAKEQARLEKLAQEQNKTVDQIKAEETVAAEKAELARIEAIAKEEGITVEEVKENEKKDLTVLERHTNDPKKLARALRKEQSEYGKVKAQLDEITAEKERAQKVVDQRKFNEVIEERREEVIDKYRENFPHDSEDQSDDVIFDRAKGLLRAAHEKAIADQKAEVKTVADNRRKEMVETLPQEFSEVKAEVKEMLDKCLDEQVLNTKFDVTFLANASRGKKYSPEYVKQLTEAAYRRGMEQPKILGATNLGQRKANPEGSKLVVSLTEQEKDRAREMFGNKGWTEDKMYQEYEKNHKGKDF